MAYIIPLRDRKVISVAPQGALGTSIFDGELNQPGSRAGQCPKGKCPIEN
jgi:hypothetical protein